MYCRFSFRKMQDQPMEKNSANQIWIEKERHRIYICIVTMYLKKKREESREFVNTRAVEMRINEWRVKKKSASQ